MIFAFARLIRYAPHEAPAPTDADLESGAAIIGRQTATYPYLVYLKDKSLLFDEERHGFCDVRGTRAFLDLDGRSRLPARSRPAYASIVS